MECVEVRERLWEYLDGALAAKEARAVHDHVEGCGWCRCRSRSDRGLLRLLAGCAGRQDACPARLRIAVLASLAAVRARD